MHFSKSTIRWAGITVLLMFLLAPLALATLNRVTPLNVFVHNVSGGHTYNAIEVGDSNGMVLSCIDTDGGFAPLSKGGMNVTFSDANGTFFYSDRCVDANKLLEYACGKDVNVNGGMAQTNNAYAFHFNCGDLNKSCSAGRCV